MMKVSFLSLAVALGVSGLALAAQAADTMTPTQVATQPAATSPATTEQQSLDAFRANVNPTMVVGTTGPYDQEDQYVNSRGYPLGGYKEIANPPQ
jgi:hypothetical protein